MSPQYEPLHDEPTPSRKKKRNMTTKQWFLVTLTSLTVLAAVAVAVTITLYCFKNPRGWLNGSRLAIQAELYEHAAVATDAVQCSIIGRDILQRNGSAVDAAIAASFCLGLYSMHSTGIGGGGLMVVYTRDTKNVDTYDYRETAPGKAREDMFANEPAKSKSGGLSVAVPGEVKGLYEAWKKHHKLAWKDLIQPTIDLCEQGYPMTLRMYEAAESMLPLVEHDAGLTKLLLDGNGRLKDLAQNLTNKPLAKTLQKIADNPEDFYTGALAENIVKDVRDAGGIITLDDLANYKVVQRKAIVSDIGDLSLLTTSAPSAGPILTYILNILKGYGFTAEDAKDDNRAILTYHRIIEAFKFGFAQKTHMGDPEFQDKEKVKKFLENMTSTDFASETRQRIQDDRTHNTTYYGAEVQPPVDHGTTHLSVYAANGDAVSVTSTINDWYGSGLRSITTGILYNNEMDDFSTPGQPTRFGFPPTASNYIKPYKRPVSSMVPVIMTDKQGDVKLVIGGSGGPRIITAVAQGIIYKLWFNDELGRSVLRPRIHHQLLPDVVGGEANRALRQKVIDGLAKIGHEVHLEVKPEYSALQAIYVQKPGRVYAKSDPRKYGHSSGY